MLTEYLKSINKNKENIMIGDHEEGEYPTFIINRCLSNFTDTILYANEMNRFPFLDKKMQYEYYLNSIRPQNRFSPWLKQAKIEEIELIKEYYDCNRVKAEQMLELMSKPDIEYICMKLNKGGFEKIKPKKQKERK